MRNLKRALSLTLASVMLLGMMVVGSSAAAGYDDVKETDNVEAIEVLQTVGVMVGDERGFGPDRPVNRAEMAVVMGLLLNLDYNYYSATCPFNDVYDWARGWVGACAANGIVSGRGDGVYDPGATVTAVEGASMLMRALGYFKYASDYADGFEVSTVRQGTTIGIFDGVGSSATEPMTRNQVAQMVLNTLKSGMVQPDGNTLNYFDSNGNIIATGGKINYVYVTSGKPFATAISNTAATSMGSVNDSPIVELGEQLYNGELKLYGERETDRRFDDFGRPARIWEYQGKEIGTYVKKELLKQEYTAKVTGQTLYELLGKSVVADRADGGYRFQIAIDGVYTDEGVDLKGASFDRTDLYRTNKDAVGRTGNGVLTQVYVDTDFANPANYSVYIAVINTYLAKANEDYDTKNDDVQVKVWRVADEGNSSAHIFVKSDIKNDDANTDKDCVDVYAKGEDFSLVKDVKKDDLYLVQVADGEIQKMWAPEILDAVTVDAFKLYDHVTTGGQQYDHATTARYDVEAIENWTSINGALNLKELTYNIILDQYGYLIGLERNEKANQYVFLTGLEAGASNLYAKQVDANVIFLDGTMDTIKVDLTKSRCGQYDADGTPHKDHSLVAHNTQNLSQMNTWCTYTVNNNGVYTLTMVPVAGTTNPTNKTIKNAQFAQDVATYNDGATENFVKKINTKRVSLNAADSTSQYVYGNDDTVYLNVSLESVTVDDNKYGNNGGSPDRMIVDDVESVITGVKNTSLVVKDLGNADAKTGFFNPTAEIYTLYNKDGVVIAAVTIGDDEGVNSTYAYVHTSGLEEESYRNTEATKSGDGEWTWLRKAIVNGEIVTLKEVGDKPEYLHPTNMVQGNWYEIKYDSNGNVRRVEDITFKNETIGGADDAKDVGKFVEEVVDVERALVENEGKILLQDDTTVDGLSYKNGTLYTKKDDTKGFSVDPDVKVVLALAGKVNSGSYGSDKVKLFDSTTDGYKGYTGLEQALREMNVKSDEFKITTVEISAQFENGRATVIVINDKNRAPDNKPGGKPTTPTGLTVTYDRTDYNGATFYLNGKEVKSEDLSYVAGGGYSFAVKTGDVVEIYHNGQFTNVNKAGTYTAADGTVYNAAANKSSVSFTVGEKSITVPAETDIEVKADAATADYVKSVKVQLNDTAKTELTSSYSLNANEDLVIEFKAKEGMTLTAGAVSAKVITSDTADYSSTTVTNVALKADTTDTYTVTIAKADAAAFAADKVDIVLTVAADGYTLNWVLPTGYRMVPGSGTTAAVAPSNSADLKLNFNGGLIGKIKTADIKIEFTGGATATYTKANVNFDSAVALTDINNTASAAAKITATAPITATVTITPKTVVYEDSTAASSKYELDSAVINGNPAVGGETTLPLLKVSAKSGDTITNGAKAKLTFTITGVEGGPMTVTTEDAVVASGNAYTIKATDFKDDTLPSFKADGTGPVSIAITKVEVTSISVSYTAASNGDGITAVTANGANVGNAAGTDIDVTGKEKITLVVTIGHQGTGSWANGTYGVKLNGTLIEGSLTDLTADGQTITVEVPVSDLGAYALTSAKQTIT